MPTQTPDQFIAELEKKSGGQLSFVVRDLDSGRELASHPDCQVPTASVYKLYVLLHVSCAAQEGTLDWNTPLILKDEHQSPGSGVLKEMTPGLSVSLRDACSLMIAVSDNSAANMVLEHVGLEAVNQRLRQFGLNHTALVAQQRSSGAPRLPYATGHTTPRETASLLIGLVQNTLAPVAVCREVREVLGGQQDHTIIGRWLPPGWSYMGKTGADADVRADVGVVAAPGGRTSVLALFCHDLPLELGWGVDHPGMLALARLARQVVYANDQSLP